MAPTKRDVLAALRRKLGDVSRQAIQQRRDRIRAIVDMPPDIATYIVAQREGVTTSKWLDSDTLRIVAEFDAQVRARERASAPPARAGRDRREKAASAPKQVAIGSVKVPPNALHPKHLSEAIRMAEVYPLLYIFENSVREFLDGHLQVVYGDDWHLDAKIVNSDMRKDVTRNRNSEARVRFHSRRNERFIYYTDIDDLSRIAGSENGWKVFKKFLPSVTWLGSIVERIEPSRHVVAHMNPIASRDTRRVADFLADWLDQIKGHEPPHRN